MDQTHKILCVNYARYLDKEVEKLESFFSICFIYTTEINYKKLNKGYGNRSMRRVDLSLSPESVMFFAGAAR